jgi:para-aminobenzoate synthetase/4-amino-4-deoxychorismate lyase
VKIRTFDSPRPDPRAGVFETLLVAGGRPVALERHLARLEMSLRELYGRELPAGVAELAMEAASGVERGRQRLTVAPDAPAASVEVAPIDELPAEPVELVPVRVPGGIGAHKWVDRRLLEQAEAAVAPALPLLVDKRGHLLEGTRANVFIVSGDELLTPPLDGRILPGVTRARVIEAAGELRLEVHERPIELDELAQADEVFLTSAIRGVLPVAGAKPLPHARQLAEALRRAD